MVSNTKQHRYFVEWSAPDYHNSGNTAVLASTKPQAISRAKKKLGNRVKNQHLSHFDAWRPSYGLAYRRAHKQ
jgi:hypothetical protein